VNTFGQSASVTNDRWRTGEPTFYLNDTYLLHAVRNDSGYREGISGYMSGHMNLVARVGDRGTWWLGLL
jgi:hypothetical protein